MTKKSFSNNRTIFWLQYPKNTPKPWRTHWSCYWWITDCNTEHAWGRGLWTLPLRYTEPWWYEGYSKAHQHSNLLWLVSCLTNHICYLNFVFIPTSIIECFTKPNGPKRALPDPLLTPLPQCARYFDITQCQRYDDITPVRTLRWRWCMTMIQRKSSLMTGNTLRRKLKR